MYNEEIKKRYLEEAIEHFEALSILGTRAFNQLEAYETELEKDCCNFTINEIIIYYQRRCSTSLDSLNTLNSILKKYTDWCMQHNMVVDNQNHYMEINQDLLYNCLNYGMVSDKIITRKDLLHVISDFLNVSDKALLLAIFEGICGDNMCDLVNLKCEDIEFKNGKYVVKLFSGKEVEISKELYEYCDQSQKTYTYLTVNSVVYEKDYNVDDRGVFKISKASNTSGINRKSLYNKLVRAKKEMKLNYLTTHTLLESGRIEMIKDIMTKTGQSLDDVLASKVTEERYGVLQSRQGWKRKYAEYIEAE